MKPIKLEINAFGSYGKHAEIDFTKTSQNLFLICGDTGSGKTTIFDAMVYALYGEGSSSVDKKEGYMLQSQFADKSVTPGVTFTFAAQGSTSLDVYKIHRVPKHYRKPKRKGKNAGGLVDTRTEVLELTLPDGSSYTERDIQDKIISIVGLSKSQFMQVAMIAQGEFMELFRADADKKKKIFRKLFDTDIYLQITEELKTRLDARHRESAKWKTECETLIGTIRLPEAYPGKEEYLKDHDRVMGSLICLEDYLEQLGALREWEENLYREMDGAVKGLEQSVHDRNKELGEAKILKDAFDNLENALKGERELLEQEDMWKGQEELVRLLGQVYEISPLYQMAVDAEKRFQDNEDALKRNREELPRCREAAEQAEQEYKARKPEWDGQQEAFHLAKDKYDRSLTVFAERRKKEQEKKELEQRKAQCDASYQKLAERLSQAEQECRKWSGIAREHEDAGILLEKARQKVREAKDREGELQKLRSLCRDWNASKKKLGEQQGAYEAAQGEARKTNVVFVRLEQEFLDNQAGILASKLEEGKPCPVCGSCHHPQPSFMTEGEICSQEQVDSAREEAERAHEKAQKAAQEAGKEAEKKEQLWQQMGELAGRISDGWGDSVEPDEWIDRESEKAKARTEDCCGEEIRNRKLVEQQREARDKQKELEAELGHIQEQTLQRQEERNRYDKELAVLASGLEEHNKQLPYQNEEEAEKEYAKAEKAYNRSRDLFQKCEERRKSARELLQKIQDRIEQQEEAGRRAGREKENRWQAFQGELQKKGMTQDQLEQYLREYSQEEYKNRKEKLEAYRGRLSQCREEVRAARRITAGKDMPDMDGLRAVLEEQSRLLREKTEEKENIQTYFQPLKQGYQKLEAIWKNHSRTYQEGVRLKRLYEIASGTVAGQNKMDLESYVQRYYLSQVLVAANRRFTTMTAGQYEIQLKEIEKAKKQRNEGLDFQVHSLVTDSYRDIKTLSGGESFMAALSLALGIADCIQGANSGIHLDMMFIDEGFGSLDDHSRNTAVRILKDLAGGRRLIGIISHVSELKDSIDDRLVVTKNNEGSSVRWEQ